MEINIEQDEYMGPLTPEAGIRVDISPQGAMPFPLDKGVSLAPGYATMIGLRKVICLLCDRSVQLEGLGKVTCMIISTYSLIFYNIIIGY